jgi:FHA domain
MSRVASVLRDTSECVVQSCVAAVKPRQRHWDAAVDGASGRRDNRVVFRPGASRRRINRTLNAAYAEGLLSDETFARRIDQLLSERLIDPVCLIGDLQVRRSESPRLHPVGAVLDAVRRVLAIAADGRQPDPILLALDWSGGQTELLIGRHSTCDVVLSDLSVSRRHARLVFRDGKWVLQDLQSTNGTVVNGTSVGRFELRPGDRLVLGNVHLRID